MDEAPNEARISRCLAVYIERSPETSIKNAPETQENCGCCRATSDGITPIFRNTLLKANKFYFW